MKKKWITILLFLLVQYINANDRLRNYDDQIAFIFDLSSKFNITEIGTVNYPGQEYKLYKITYGITETNNAKKYLFISGIHGNEAAPIYEIKDFIQHLDTIEMLDITIDFIYILNPWGFEHNNRYNGDGIDLNRDFASFKTEEIRCLINSIKNEKYTGMYDFHEHSATTGFLLYYYSNKNKGLADNILKMLENKKILLENEYIDIVLKTKDGAIKVPFYAKMYYSIKKMATSGLYFDKINVEEVFVFETPMVLEIKKRQEIVNMLLEYIAAK